MLFGSPVFPFPMLHLASCFMVLSLLVLWNPELFSAATRAKISLTDGMGPVISALWSQSGFTLKIQKKLKQTKSTKEQWEALQDCLKQQCIRRSDAALNVNIRSILGRLCPTIFLRSFYFPRSLQVLLLALCFSVCFWQGVIKYPIN